MLRFLFYFIIIILLFRLIFSFLFRSTKKEKENKRKNYYSSTKRDGEVNIDYTPDKKKWIDKESGDYIDFEEMD